ncbi:unnamed protein product [Amoebophrya sp. A25]|nr:unnamed protein product [Amoebophrya sp. A25]|eukprot:GSA25T00002616001.1
MDFAGASLLVPSCDPNNGESNLWKTITTFFPERRPPPFVTWQ